MGPSFVSTGTSGEQIYSPWDVNVTIESPACREAAIRQWRNLEASLTNVPLTCSSSWTEAWLTVYGELVPHSFAFGRINKEIRAMALVCRGVGQRYGPIPVRTIHIGTSGEPEEHQVYVEYNSVLCEPALHDAFLGNLITELRRDPDVDEIRLDGFVSAEVDKFMPANTLRHEKPSHYFDLADARTKTDDPITLLGRSIRYDLRRKLRDLSSIQTEWAADTTRAHEIVDEMIELHQTRWTAAGKPGAYASEYFRRFTREIVERLVPEGRSALVRVYDQDGVIGCNHLLFDRDRVLKFQGGTVSFDGSKRSPGLISDFMSIRESFERGYSAFDHLEGDTRAKRNLSTSVNQLVWAQVRQPSLRLRVVNSLKRFRSLSRNCRELCSAAPFLKKFKK